MRRTRWLLWALLALPFAAAGCSTILGIGTLDAGPAQTDASLADVVVDAAPAPNEAAPPPDAGAPEVACVPVAVMDGAAADSDTCPVDDGGCPMVAVPSSALSWVAPEPRKACTSAEIADFITTCIVPGKDTPACETFKSAHATCASCIITPIDNGTRPLGPLAAGTIGGLEYDVTNFGGCIAALEPCNEACGRAVLALSECQFAACGGSCAQGETCLQNAEACPCAALGHAEGDCIKDIQDRGSPAAVCVPGPADTLASILQRIIPPLCAAD